MSKVPFGSQLNLKLVHKNLIIIVLAIGSVWLVSALSLQYSNSALLDSIAEREDFDNRIQTIANQSYEFNSRLLLISSDISNLASKHRENIYNRMNASEQTAKSRQEVQDKIKLLIVSSFGLIANFSQLDLTKLDSELAKNIKMQVQFISRSTTLLERLFLFYRTSNNHTLTLQSQNQYQKALSNFNFEEKAREKATVDYIKKMVGVSQDFFKNINLVGDVLSDISHQQSDEEIASRRNITLILLILLSSGVVFLSYYFTSRQIAKPIVDLSRQMTEVSDGNVEIKILRTKRLDEIGDMARALEFFRKNKIEKFKLDEKFEASQKEAELKKQEEQKQLSERFESSIQKIIAMVADSAQKQVTIAEKMVGYSDNTSKLSQTVSGASQETNEGVKHVASASQELTAAIEEISSQVLNTTKAVAEAGEGAQRADTTARSLSEATTKIGEVTGIIQEITDQINLLALNATIEAARAGEAGRGFSVVASEVKDLANQTASATQDIIRLIEGVRQVSIDVNDVLGDIHKDIDKIGEFTNGISSAIEQQNTTTQIIMSNMDVASDRVGDIVQSIAGIENSAQETDKASQEALSSARTITDQMGTLNEEVEHFLSGIKVA